MGVCTVHGEGGVSGTVAAFLPGLPDLGGTGADALKEVGARCLGLIRLSTGGGFNAQSG